MNRNVWNAGLLAALGVWSGCDVHAPHAVPSQVRIDVRPLFYASQADAEPCASVAESLVLTVRGSDGNERTYREVLTPEETVLRIDAEAAPGETRFEAQVLSVNGALLYAGQVTASIADGFSVTVPLTKRAPVLQVCPATLVLPATPRSAAFTVRNRGTGPLAWTTFSPSLPCNGVPCLLFDEASGVLEAGASEQVLVVAEPLFARGVAEIRSPQGTLSLDVQLR